MVVCWLKSDGEHCQTTLAVEVGREHYQPRPAVEDGAEDEEEQQEEEGTS